VDTERKYVVRTELQKEEEIWEDYEQEGSSKEWAKFEPD